ncbi:MAG TPA: hypothetical protein VHY56_14510, partial [Candidatus Binataceae bacterium]|nr:hypothetical protein [Candidatus Binataceae bacterium]
MRSRSVPPPAGSNRRVIRPRRIASRMLGGIRRRAHPAPTKAAVPTVFLCYVLTRNSVGEKDGRNLKLKIRQRIG